MSETNYITLGKKSRAIIRSNEPIVNLPNLLWLYSKAEESINFTTFFPESSIFIAHVRLMLDKTAMKSVEEFLDLVIEWIRDDSDLSEDEDEMLLNFPTELYVEALKKSFSDFIK